MRARIWVSIALVIILLIGPFGVRFTTADAKHKAEMQEVRTAQLEDDFEELQKDFKDLNKRHSELLDYMEENYSESDQIERQPSPNFIRIPGSSDNSDSDGNDETRIIERNNTTTVPNSDDNSDSDSDGDTPPILEAPDINKTKDNLLKGTPLDGML